jgi:uncharacterized DUF497 family protein
MLDLGRARAFQCEAGNAHNSAEKHDVSQGEAERAFLNEPRVVAVDARHSAGEPRYHALGRTDGNRPLHVTFTLRENGTLIRIISARDMSRKERSRHAEAR